MKPYPEYKPTGLAWLPQVPSGWKVCRLTFRYSVQLGKMLDSQKITGEFLVPYVRNQDVQWDHINLYDLPLMDIKPEERERFCARQGDLLVCEGGEIGRTALLSASDKVFFQKAIMRLRVQDEEQDFPRFMFYVMYTASAYGAFSAATGKSTIAHLPAEKLSAARFAFPPPAEQRAIVSYLDRETAKIDRLIQLKERMVELLQEKRGAIISSVVTGKVEVEKVGGGGEESKSRVEVEGGEESRDEGGVSATLTQRTQRAQSDAKSVGADVLGRPQGFEADRINRIYRIDNEANAKIPLRSFAYSAFSASAPAGSQNPVNPVNPVQFTTRARRPDELTDSGVDWLGPVPKGWKKIPLKRVVVSRDSGAWGYDPDKDEGEICLRIADFDYGRGMFKDTAITELTRRKYSEKDLSWLILLHGDILIEKSGGGDKYPVGRAVLFDKAYRAGYANFMDRIRVDQLAVLPKYFLHWWRTLYKRGVTWPYVKQTTGIQNLDIADLLVRESIMLPPLPEQREIVAYLDAATAKIDAAVKAIETSIGLLKERRVRLVSDAVTGRGRVGEK